MLTALSDAPRPLGVGEVAEQVGLHPNTARFHLEGLVEAGLVERAVEAREQPGRPRALYAARAERIRDDQRSYQLLAEVLTSYVATQVPEPAKAARRTGEEWGRYLAERPAPFQQVDAAEAMRQVLRALDDVGFAPEPAVGGRDRQILMRHCPFRETAQQHSDVVCSIHLGLMQGMLAEMGAPLEAERLERFVEPSLCVAHLGERRTTGG